MHRHVSCTGGCSCTSAGRCRTDARRWLCSRVAFHGVLRNSSSTAGAAVNTVGIATFWRFCGLQRVCPAVPSSLVQLAACVRWGQPMKHSFGRGGRILPDHGIAALHPLQLRVVDHVGLRRPRAAGLHPAPLASGVRPSTWYSPTAPLLAVAAPKSLQIGVGSRRSAPCPAMCPDPGHRARPP